MTDKYKIYVVDCDHGNVDAEKQVLASSCNELPWLKCRTEDEVIAQCADAEALIVQYAPMTRRVMEQLKRCKVIVRYGVGVDNIDLKAAADLGIIACNVPDYGTEEVADHALALMLCLTRKVAQASALVKKGIWDFGTLRPITRHQVQTIGVISIGRIGASMARKAHALGMKVLAHDPWIDPKLVPDFARLVTLEELLQQSDVVSVHCPLTEQTRNLLNEKTLGLMKPSSYLVNTARGNIVDEVALEKALVEKKLAGAGFDVLSVEPAKPDHPLFRLDNFLCTPHMAWHSTEAAHDLKRKAAEEALHILRGDTPRYQVNKK